MKYTYTLKMTGNYNSPVNMEQADIDVEYWTGMARRTRLYSTRIRTTILQGMAQLYRIRL